MSAENADLYKREASDRSDLYRKEQQNQRSSMYAEDNDFRKAGRDRVAREKEAKEDRDVRDYVEGRKLNLKPLRAEAAHMMGEGPKHDEAVKANIMSATERGITSDAVNLPAHYARYKIEPIRFLVENFGPVILVGKVVKYSMRYDAKNGLEDIAKAKRCLHMLDQFVRGNPDWWKRTGGDIGG